MQDFAPDVLAGDFRLIANEALGVPAGVRRAGTSFASFQQLRSESDRSCQFTITENSKDEK
jgi:hypothetical protein